MRQVSVVAGQQVAGYRIESLLARGGMAVVYRATELQLARTVALKLLSPELSANEQFEQRFMKESQLAAACDHPNIIPIYAAGEEDGVLYIAMRFVDGQDLAGVLKQELAVEPARAVMLFRQVAAALDAAHEHGLVHRDVKPGNILISSGIGREETDHVYLTDFGVTKRSSSISHLTATGSFVGTMDYIAPEQIAGKGVDARTDIYSLGCVVFQALTGSVPFERDEDAALMWAHLAEPAPAVTSRQPLLGTDVDAVLAKALAKDPADRFDTCRTFIGALHDALDRSPIVLADRTNIIDRPGWIAAPAAASRRGDAGRPDREPRPTRAARKIVSVVPPGRRRTRRRLALALGAAAVAVAVAVVTTVSLIGRNGPGDRTYRDSELSTKYPHAWSAANHPGDIYRVLSPKAANLLNLFDNQGDGWTAVHTLLTTDAKDLVGVYLGGVNNASGALGAADAQDSVQALVGSDAAVTVQQKPTTRRLAGGYQATDYIGTLSGPGNVGPLRFEYLSVQTTPTSRAVLIDFGEPAAFAGSAAAFRLIEANLKYARPGS